MAWVPSDNKALLEPTLLHYSDVILGVIASQITSLTLVYLTVYSDTDQRKHQSSASLAFVRGTHRGPVNSPHKWPVMRKMLPFDDVIMLNLCHHMVSLGRNVSMKSLTISLALFTHKTITPNAQFHNEGCHTQTFNGSSLRSLYWYLPKTTCCVISPSFRCWTTLKRPSWHNEDPLETKVCLNKKPKIFST